MTGGLPVAIAPLPVGEGDLEFGGEPVAGLVFPEPGLKLLPRAVMMLRGGVAMFLPFVVESNAAVVPG
jgi:hypothetical protein